MFLIIIPSFTIILIALALLFKPLAIAFISIAVVLAAIFIYRLSVFICNYYKNRETSSEKKFAIAKIVLVPIAIISIICCMSSEGFASTLFFCITYIVSIILCFVVFITDWYKNKRNK